MDWDQAHKMVKIFLHGLPFAIIYSLLFFRELVFIHSMKSPIPIQIYSASFPLLILMLVFMFLGTTALNPLLTNLLWDEQISMSTSAGLFQGLVLTGLLSLAHNLTFVFVPYLSIFQTILAVPFYAIVDGYTAREVTIIFTSGEQEPFAEPPMPSREGLEIVGPLTKDRGRCPFCNSMNEFAREDIEEDGTAECAICHKRFFVLTRDVLLRELGENPDRIDL